MRGLARAARKTTLIVAIAATEFAMAIEYQAQHGKIPTLTELGAGVPKHL